MNRKQEEENRRKIHKLVDMVLDVNGLSGSHPTAFLRFSGHVGKLEIEIYPNGWHRDCSDEERKRYEFSTDKPIKDKDMDNIRKLYIALGLKTEAESFKEILDQQQARALAEDKKLKTMQRRYEEILNRNCAAIREN